MKDRLELLKNKIKSYLNKEQLSDNDEYKKLELPFSAKARKNFTVANLMFNISEEDELRKLLHLSSDFEIDDWAIIVAYYSMYASGLSALAHLGYK